MLGCLTDDWLLDGCCLQRLERVGSTCTVSESRRNARCCSPDSSRFRSCSYRIWRGILHLDQWSDDLLRSSSSFRPFRFHHALRPDLSLLCAAAVWDFWFLVFELRPRLPNRKSKQETTPFLPREASECKSLISALTHVTSGRSGAEQGGSGGRKETLGDLFSGNPGPIKNHHIALIITTYHA